MSIKLPKLLRTLALCLSLCLLISSQVAAAHEFVPDSTGKTGAIFHVTPSDDPVAGTKTGIYYEVDSVTSLSSASVSLVVKSDTGGIVETLPVAVSGQTVSAAFNFPIRGLYFLRLTVSKNDKKTVIFESSQRITHSKKGTDLSVETPAWAKVGLVLSVWLTALLLIIAVKRRKRIVSQSN